MSSAFRSSEPIGSINFLRSMTASSTSNLKQQKRVSQPLSDGRSSVDSRCLFFEAEAQSPESSSPGEEKSSLVGERAALIYRAAPACRRIVARRDDGRWLCISCAEPHTIKAPSGPGAYCAKRYALVEKARREKRVSAGLCAECAQPREIDGNARLCQKHRAMSAVRKRRMRERAMHAIRDNLYGHRADIEAL